MTRPTDDSLREDSYGTQAACATLIARSRNLAFRRFIATAGPARQRDILRVFRRTPRQEVLERLRPFHGGTRGAGDAARIRVFVARRRIPPTESDGRDAHRARRYVGMERKTDNIGSIRRNACAMRGCHANSAIATMRRPMMTPTASIDPPLRPSGAVCCVL